MQWIVGRNKHDGEWSEGGTKADYPEEHWEVFQVEANDRNHALRLAQAQRRNRKARERRKKEEGNESSS